ncbi:twin-arginine translocation signal domain-containing protein, partial [Burkholderia sp. MR1-5-21]
MKHPERAALSAHTAAATSAGVNRRQFLGYAGAGLLAAALPGCGDAMSATPYRNTIAAARQSIQAALG